MENKLGVYICTGCGIGEALDIEKLTAMGPQNGAAVVKTHEFLCGEKGSQIIQEDIKDEGINTIVIAGCSPRVNFDVFDYPGSLVERINLREHVIWSHTPNDEDTQMLAEDYMRMGISKVKKMELSEPHIEEDLTKAVLVIGGGITGMTAAIESAKAGYGVVLVEKEDKLGGFMGKLHKKLPMQYPYAKLEDPGVEAIVAKIDNDPDIKVYTSAEVGAIAGQPGQFDVTINTSGGAVNAKVGSVVLATGWKPYDATKLDTYGYGEFANVVTNVQLEEMAKNGKIVRPSDGRPAKNVAFIQCAGQRDPEHLSYCSSVCCLTSLKQAMYVRQQDKNAKAYIFYKDMRTPGSYELFYKAARTTPFS